MARDGRDRRDRGPRTDRDDQSNIPEHLRNLSFRMAMFLRYDAAKMHNLDEGWLLISTLLEDLSRSHPTETWNETDVLKIVETSFRGDKPRFEAMERIDGYRVRAAPKAGRQDEGWDQSWGSSTDKRSHDRYDKHDRHDRHDRRHRHDRHDRYEDGNSRPFSAKGSIEIFDGFWGRENEADYLCDIRRTMLKWKDADEMVKVRVSGSKILVPDGTSGCMTQGTLSADKQRIIFDDDDHWVRHQTEADADTSKVDSPRGKNPAQSAEAFDISTPLRDVVQWEQHRVQADWDAPGGEYLSLKEGELLLVKPELDQGWAFGKSCDSGKSGYFPPTYAEREDSS